MDTEAFTVLPPLSPRLPPPPPTPAPTRVAPPTVAHKESSAFVIISELPINGPPIPESGRTSPFRGRGFREPSPSSRIPVPSGRSAPASPVRKAKPQLSLAPQGGKSAPASPKRVTTRPPQVPKNSKKTADNRRNLVAANKPQGKSQPNTLIAANKPPVQISRKKPTPAVRNKISGKAKPISTEISIGSLGKNRFIKPPPPAVAPRKPVDKNEGKESKSGADKKIEPNDEKKEVLSITQQPKDEPQAPKSQEEKSMEMKPSPPENVTILDATPETQPSKTEEPKSQHHSPPNDANTPQQTKIVVAQVTSTPKAVHVEANVREIPVHAVNGLSPGQKIHGTGSSVEPEATLVEWTTKHPKELAQPDIIPNDAIEEVKTTVEGPAEVEVQAGNHTVTFRSPEIHPVSPRVKKLGLYRRLKDGMTGGGCFKFTSLRRRSGGKVSPTAAGKLIKGEAKDKKEKQKKKGEKKGKNAKESEKNLTNSETETLVTDNNNKKGSKFSSKMAALSKFNSKKKDPPPPRLTEAQANTKDKAQAKLSLLNRINCFKKKEGRAQAQKKSKSKPKLLRSQATAQPAGGQSRWRKVFCLDRACCVKCRKKADDGAGAKPPPKIKKPEFKRSMSNGGGSLPKLDQTLVEHASVMKAAIPVLPICLAWTCLLINVFLPGIGTITSGFLCLCFGKPRFSVNDSMRSRLGSLSVNLVIGIGQLFTVIFCLVGWGWSIWWGIIMLKLARKNRRIKLAEKAGGGTVATPVNRNQGDLELGPGE